MLVARRNNWMPTLFGELMNWNGWNDTMCETTTSMPKMNISESDDDYRVEFNVAGLKKEDLNISIDSENRLVVEMVKNAETSDESNTEATKERRYMRREFSTMQFKQAFTLPENVKRDQISARVEHGILTIDLPKYTEEEKKALSQTIEIK